MEETKPWYLSKTIIGAIIQLLVFIDVIFRLEIGGETINQLIIGIFGVVGLVMVIYGRLKAKLGVTVLGREF